MNDDDERKSDDQLIRRLDSRRMMRIVKNGQQEVTPNDHWVVRKWEDLDVLSSND